MIIGIDPGTSGAIVVRGKNQHVWMYDIPTMTTDSITGNNVKKQRSIDISELIRIVMRIKSNWADSGKIIVVCEYSAGMAFTGNRVRAAYNDSVITAWKKGYNFGVVHALFHNFGMPFTCTPRPNDWKRKMGLIDSTLTYPQKKEKARLRAIDLHPTLEPFLKRKKDADRAEALLLIDWYELTKGNKGEE